MACDPACSFEPTSLAYDIDPHPTLAHLREHHPVYRWPQQNAWVLTRHADVDWLLKQAPVGTNDLHWNEAASSPQEAGPWDRLRRETITFKEGEEHLHLRHHVSRTFTRGAVERLTLQVRDLVAEALDAAEEAKEGFDLARDLASRVPIRVLGILMGVTPEMEEGFCRDALRLQNAINPLSDASALREADLGAEGFLELIGELIRRAEARPGDDLVSALLQPEAGASKLDRTAITGLITSIIMAGAESTGALVNHAVLTLLRHPDELARLRADPSLMRSALEEVGRFEFPTKFVTRYPLEDLEIGGQQIRAGDLVFGSPGAANRDPRVFTDPDRFDITRPIGPSLLFGAGAHFCLGASLARVEAQEMVGQLIRRFPALEQAGEPTFSPHFNIRLISSLPLRLGPSST